ncbi:DEAD/DEAH box helicase family protein, partial [Candidatus Desantisbacteria bacterium]|nr:DEAD/DEAH box helicase family protein [Candidatus Desantisbacteria bacterium]
KLDLSKEVNLPAELAKVKELYPICSDFERNFPSLCFALATGVGKTRLMGAFVAYLYLEKGIKNFFVLSPNLTIYNKLIEDFSNPAHPKYVFKGIGEFAQNPPRIITGDNYLQASQTTLFHSEIKINVFNIAKINAESRQGAEPRIKRLSEYIGDSYFNYLSNLDDLVLLMDESHHYRADRGMQVINELKPILGLELTATPQVERGSDTIKFKNVVYEYSLSHAIEDGFVKEPAVATRKDFDPLYLSQEEVDLIKIEDGIRIHEDTKIALDIYARNNKVDMVKPFVLIVAKDTEHAGRLKTLIQSNSFFEGRYADKVMEIHSNQRGAEKEENIQQLLSLEDVKNRIEIVIHVNMLKEGWDVTNLYTIIPVRTAASTTLREQTIGRGLRLPYGKRTGDKKVDTLTIVAHDKFQQIIDEANKPDSIIRQKNIIEINPEELHQDKEIITSAPVWEQNFIKRAEEIALIKNVEERQKAEQQLQVERDITDILPTLNTEVKSVQELTGQEAKEVFLSKYKERLYNQPQAELFIEQKIEAAEEAYERVTQNFIRHVIEIPRMVLQQADEVHSGFNDFDLKVSNLNYQVVSEEILVQRLREQEDGISYIKGKGRIVPDKLDNIIVNELFHMPEIDYDSQADLLFKLAGQAIMRFNSYLKTEDERINVVQYNKREIARFIYAQMMDHFYCESPRYEDVTVLPFVTLKDHNFFKYTADSVYPFTETVEPASSIPGKVFVGFQKACHLKYKFDSKTEKDFAIILEKDEIVLKWLRPAEGQFEIWWAHNSKRYNPDFVVETNEAIYLVETKMQKDMDSKEVKEKAKAALYYCEHAARFALRNGKKPWKYILIPHEAVQFNMGFGRLAKQYVIDKG